MPSGLKSTRNTPSEARSPFDMYKKIKKSRGNGLFATCYISKDFSVTKKYLTPLNLQETSSVCLFAGFLWWRSGHAGWGLLWDNDPDSVGEWNPFSLFFPGWSAGGLSQHQTLGLNNNKRVMCDMYEQKVSNRTEGKLRLGNNLQGHLFHTVAQSNQFGCA